MSNLLFIDTETTGKDPERNCIIQLAAQYYEGDKLVASYNEQYPNTGFKTSLEALSINKITISSLELRGRAKNITSFLDFLLKLPKDKDITVVGHNVDFDLNFIKAAVDRECFTELENILNYRNQDTCVIAGFLRDAGLLDVPDVSLEILAKHFEVPTDKLHTADGDVEITRLVYNKLMGLVKGV